MSFEDIETIWRSPHNRPTPAELEAQKAQLARRLRGRYRTFILTIGAGMTGLIGCSAAIIRYLLAGGAFDLDREWAGLLFFALPLIAAAVLIRQYRSHRRRHATYHRSISATLQAALDENRLERKRIKLFGGLYAVMVLAFPVAILQLLAVGKANAREVPSMIVLFAGLVLVVCLALAHRYRRRLLPRKRELETLLGAYEQDLTATDK